MLTHGHVWPWQHGKGRKKVCVLNKCNLPGWRWARIKQLALVGLSSSWHSEACNALRDSTGVAYSEISVRGNQRTRGCQQLTTTSQRTRSRSAHRSAVTGCRGAIHDIGVAFLQPKMAYLLGLLAMIKCSICSYQYDN